MGKIRRKIAAAFVVAALAAISTVSAFADASGTYVALGADLSVAQRATVLELLGLTEEELADMDVVQITN